MGAKVRTARKYAIRAVVFQEGDWLCAQCLEYDLVAQAKSLPRLYEALRRLIIGHIAVRARHRQQPFLGLPRAPQVLLSRRFPDLRRCDLSGALCG